MIDPAEQLKVIPAEIPALSPVTVMLSTVAGTVDPIETSGLKADTEIAPAEELTEIVCWADGLKHAMEIVASVQDIVTGA